MNEADFKIQWENDKPAYLAWGELIVDSITHDLMQQGTDLGTFLKAPVTARIKNDSSLIDKAFYRPGKKYTNPYTEIEDKVGVRFIVLLLDDIKTICEIIEKSEIWDFDACKHFDSDKEKDPLLFTYQSVHYILRPKVEIKSGNISILTSVPCEVQIRTLLQHAHAELTHDAIYKAKRVVQPNVHRTVAKCMALIETTDQYFKEVTLELNQGPLTEHNILGRLDGIYLSLTGIKSHTEKSTIVIWDEFEQFIDDKLVDNIQKLIDENDFLPQLIKDKYTENAFYQQSSVLFLYWMLKKRKVRLLSDWPFPKKLLDPLAIDLGISTFI
jgi:ppGpp synthetase/RelA/SpoT-type nucleotidyltranferase